MPLQIRDLSIGDHIYNDATGRTRYKVVQKDDRLKEAMLWSESRHRSTILKYEDLEQYWSIGTPNTGWKVENW